MNYNCALCGNPATGHAYIGLLRYCHGDEDVEPTCYMQGQWDLSDEKIARRRTNGMWLTEDKIMKAFSPAD